MLANSATANAQKALLTEELAITAIRDFFREPPFLFLGTGMSCAVDIRFGMGALRDVLIDEIPNLLTNDEAKQQWENVQQALKTEADLESALDSVTDLPLLQAIISVTGKFISGIDHEYAIKIAQDSTHWPAIHFIKRLVDKLPEGDRVLHVLTPNYDMLVEYASDSVGIKYANGFFGGIEKTINWNAVNQALLVSEPQVRYGRFRPIYKPEKHIRLYKVHGSLNYFFHHNRVVENDAWMWNPPDFAQRVIITPGLSKYETLQCYRQELLKSADDAIEKASHFLFIGYGFNDNHLEEYVRRKLIKQSCNGLIITRDSNPRIESILKQSPNLWLVCKRHMEDGTRIFNCQYEGWLQLPSQNLWDIAEFHKRIFGG